MSQDSLLFFDRNRNLIGDSALNKTNWYLGQKNKFFVFELVLASFFRFQIPPPSRFSEPPSEPVNPNPLPWSHFCQNDFIFLFKG